MNNHDRILIENIEHSCRCLMDPICSTIPITDKSEIVIKSFDKVVYGGYMISLRFGSSNTIWKFNRSINRNKLLYILKEKGYTILTNIKEK